MSQSRFFGLIKTTFQFDYVSKRFLSFIFSIFLFVVTFVSLGTKGLNYGIDFSGGVLMEIQTQGPADLKTLRAQLNQLNLGDVGVQNLQDSPDRVMIRLPLQVGDDQVQQRALDAVKQTLGPHVSYLYTQLVGPTVGAELIEKGIWAVSLTILGICIYIWLRFELPFALGALLALLHDVFTTIGLFSFFQLDFSLTIVAAVLAIAGYSINDTVVTYDRVRENLRRYRKMPIRDLLNLSMNQTLSRTILTSFTTLLSVLAIYWFGGPVLEGFAIAFLWGIFIGTYSSIFVALPFLMYFDLRDEGEPAKTQG